MFVENLKYNLFQRGWSPTDAQFKHDGNDDRAADCDSFGVDSLTPLDGDFRFEKNLEGLMM